MSEVPPSTELLWAKYRGEYAPIPRAESITHLTDLIAGRVKPGLLKLLDSAQIQPIDYAGYAITNYRTPLEMLEIFSMFGGKDTVNAMQTAGLAVDTVNVKDDFWVEYFEHFDHMLHRKHRDAWPQGYDEATELTGFKGTNFLLGPVIRGPLQLKADEYNQNIDTQFSHSSAVYVTGELLLKGLYQHEPQLREGWAISSETLASYLIEAFGLEAQIESPTTYA